MTGPANRPARKPRGHWTPTTPASILGLDQRPPWRRGSPADYALLRSMHAADAVNALSLAKSEVTLAFADRWASIARLPASLRAAAIAALTAEQAAAFTATIGPRPPGASAPA